LANRQAHLTKNPLS